jgi:CubicO group peptidase (beta-lactamase class C family)
MKQTRRQFLAEGAAAAMMANPSSSVAGQWLAAAPEEVGFAADLEDRLDKAIAEKRIWNLHGLAVFKNDRMILERYFEGDDHIRGVGAVGRVAFASDTLHDLRSCSKSIVGLLYGIALEQRKVPPPEAPLFSAFPEYADLADKAGRNRLAVQHVLTMTMGTDWDESSLPYSDPPNSETAMDNAADRYRYVLERSVIDAPGAHWTYWRCDRPPGSPDRKRERQIVA